MNDWFIVFKLGSIIIFVFEFVDEVLMSNYTWILTLLMIKMICFLKYFLLNTLHSFLP